MKDSAAHDPLGPMRAELARIAAAPADAPQGMPGWYYTDPDLFAHERATVLRDGWHCVGRADELAEPGAYRALQLLDEPLVIVRDGDRIRALSNVCRHRGMPLVQGTGRAKLLVCSYHAWSYRTDGQLVRAPRMENAGFDAKACKLGEFACVERFGFVYVCLADTPPDLDAALTGLTEAMQPYDAMDYRIVHRASEVWRTNWKCLLENFMEGYHLSVVHPRTLHGYTPTDLSRKGPDGPGFTSYTAHYPPDIPSRGTGAATLSDAARHSSFLFAAFPAQVASISASLLVSLSILPRSTEEIEVQWTMSTYGDDLDDDTIAQRIALWSEVNREDREKLELMQRALHSRHATGGPLAGPDFEGTVRDVLLWLAAQDAGYP